MKTTTPRQIHYMTPDGPASGYVQSSDISLLTGRKRLAVTGTMEDVGRILVYASDVLQKCGYCDEAWACGVAIDDKGKTPVCRECFEDYHGSGIDF